jgi:nicotinamide mononucleotide transporter
MFESLQDFWAVHGLRLMDILGTIVGLWYLWLEYRASITLWIVGIIMPAMYIFTYYKAGLYADFGMQIYYLLAATYGWCCWKFGRQKNTKKEIAISHTPPRVYLLCTVAFLAAWAVIYWILIRFTNSNVPVCDSFVNALSIVGLWMLARKYVEQWLVWFVVDAFSCGLYVYKGIPFTAGLYGLYTVIAILGYRKWLRMMREETPAPQPAPAEADKDVQKP